MNWSLLPTAAVFCSVLPGEYMSGMTMNIFLFYTTRVFNSGMKVSLPRTEDVNFFVHEK